MTHIITTRNDLAAWIKDRAGESTPDDRAELEEAILALPNRPRYGVRWNEFFESLPENFWDLLDAPTPENILKNARELGAKDGAEAAHDGRLDGTYRKGASSDWDSGLINAIGNKKTRELFGLEGDANPADDALYSAALVAYNAAATEAYDAA